MTGPISGYMQRIEISVYQFSVHGLYNPRQSGLVGYVATTFVIVGVSIARSAASVFSSAIVVIVQPLVEVAPRVDHHVLAGGAIAARQRDHLVGDVVLVR